MQKDGPLKHQRLLELLAYDAATGEFTWKVDRTGLAQAGAKAGRPLSGDYWRICVDGIDYSAHRLAWFYVTGVWPEGEIDHINRVKSDNRFANLRDVTRSVNQQNKDIYANNKSGFKGVSWNTSDKRWRAAITAGGKKKFLGNFKTASEASLAYETAKQSLHKAALATT